MARTVVGYDPGGDGKHGLALATIRDGRTVSLCTQTLNTVEEVMDRLLACDDVQGIGIDTLTCWSTGRGGWRPADRWLRCQYPCVAKSVVAPNSLYGSMGLSGMALLVALRKRFPNVFITETHPKVLYYAKFRERYDYGNANRAHMDGQLSRLLGTTVAPKNDHEWDAAISVLPVIHGLQGSWTHDLHKQATNRQERLIHPCGRTAYVWPG